MKMCEYKFRNGERCKEEALPGSQYCILHVDLPEDEESEEFKRINKSKEEKVKEKISKGDFCFEGAELSRVDFSWMTIVGSLAFDYAVIRNDASFTGAKIGGIASFERAEIGRDVAFNFTEIKGACSFKDAKFKIPKAQEEACRTARKTQERIGDRVLADYHFYREMEAKRKRKYKKYSLKPILKLMRKLVVSQHVVDI